MPWYEYDDAGLAALDAYEVDVDDTTLVPFGEITPSPDPGPPPPPPPPPNPTSGDWREAPLFEPDPTQTIFGMFTSTGDSLDSLETLWGAPIQMTRLYTGSGLVSGLASAQTHLNNGRVPVVSINWKAELKAYSFTNTANRQNIDGTGLTLFEYMAAGHFDGNLSDGNVTISGLGTVPGFRRVARIIKAYTQGACPTNQIILTPWHEFENVNESGFGHGVSSSAGFNASVYSAFRAAWQRLKFIFDDEGVTNVYWGFCGATGVGHWGSSLTDTSSTGFYPGHAYVDHVMYDPYNKSGQQTCGGTPVGTGYNNSWRDFGPLGHRGDSGTHVLDTNGQTSWYFDRFKMGGKPTIAQVTGSEGVYKPVILGEFGTGEVDPNDSANPNKNASVWFDRMADWLEWARAQPEGSPFIGVIYFHNLYNVVTCTGSYRRAGFTGRGNQPVWATVT